MPDLGQDPIVTQNDRFLQMGTDYVPNFVRRAVDNGGQLIYSIQSGPWSSPSTWNLGRAPALTDNVAIGGQAGQTHVVTGTAVMQCQNCGIYDGGTLDLTAGPCNLLCVTLETIPAFDANGHALPTGGGKLLIGQPGNPATGLVVVTFRDVPFSTGDIAPDGTRGDRLDPAQWGHGYVGLGQTVIYGPEKTGHARLAAEAMAGATSFTLASPVNGWRRGDTILFPDTTQYIYGQEPLLAAGLSEMATLAADVPDGGFTFTVTSPLAHDHRGCYDRDNRIFKLPHVASLGPMSVRFVSENPQGTRPHFVVCDLAYRDTQYFSIDGFGRTSCQAEDSTGFSSLPDPSQPIPQRYGVVSHYGTVLTQIGRYQDHTHRVVGRAGQLISDGGVNYIARIKGVRELNCAARVTGDHVNDLLDQGKGAIVVHMSHGVLVEDNVVHRALGAGIVCEGMGETVTIKNNFVSQVVGSGNIGEKPWADGTGIWFAASRAKITNNFVCNVWGQYSFGYTAWLVGVSNVLPNIGTAYFPTSPGQPMDQWVPVDMRGEGIAEFSGNEVWASSGGMSTWWIGIDGTTISPIPGTPKSTIQLSVFNCTTWAVFAYPQFNVDYQLTTMADFGWAGKSSFQAFYPSDYQMAQVSLINCNIQGYFFAIASASNFSAGYPEFSVSNSTFACDYVLQTSVPGSVGIGGFGNPAHFILESSTVLDPQDEWDGPHRAVYVDQVFDTTTGILNPLQRWTIDVKNWPLGSGKNWRIYDKHQAPGFPVPVQDWPQGSIQHGAPAHSPPYTNANYFAATGQCVYGELIPANAVQADSYFVDDNAPFNGSAKTNAFIVRTN